MKLQQETLSPGLVAVLVVVDMDVDVDVHYLPIIRPLSVRPLSVHYPSMSLCDAQIALGSSAWTIRMASARTLGHRHVCARDELHHDEVHHGELHHDEPTPG